MTNAPLLSNFVSLTGGIVNMTSHLEATYQTNEITKEIKAFESEYGDTWTIVWRVYYSDEDYLENVMYVDSRERAERVVRKTANRWIDE